ncbi:hypothetical protein TWF481_011370 [Arthrobotrys musiformis]|uniref:Uncharacterized protein n=1 Tax=Arthrobotrys musiformis TaxID=47236 RepID=A0AAV9VZK7_9PEZI
MSPSWWQAFAKHPFIGVERLALSCTGILPYEKKLLKISGEETRASSTSFELEKIQISGLNWFSIDQGQNCRYPVGFLERVLENNPQIPSSCTRLIVKTKRDVRVGKMKARIPEIVKVCGDKLSQQLDAALEGCAEEFTNKFFDEKRPLQRDFEKSIEDATTEQLIKKFEKEYASTFAKMCAETLQARLRVDDNGVEGEREGNLTLSDSGEDYEDDEDEDNEDDDDNNSDNDSSDAARRMWGMMMGIETSDEDENTNSEAGSDQLPYEYEGHSDYEGIDLML